MLKSELQSGDIVLTSRPFQDSRISGVIKVGTLSKYSHAMLFIGNERVVEAIGEGVVIRALTEAVQGCDLASAFRHSQATDKQIQEIVRFAKSKEDGEYAVPGVLAGSGIVAFGMAPLSVPFMAGRSINNAIRERMGKKRSYYCSELVVDAYLSAGLPLGIYGRTPSLMNPGDIAEYSDRNPKTLVRLGNLA